VSNKSHKKVESLKLRVEWNDAKRRTERPRRAGIEQKVAKATKMFDHGFQDNTSRTCFDAFWILINSFANKIPCPVPIPAGTIV